MTIRSSGILLHPSSLPSAYGIGDLGPGAYRFADFLAASGQRLWQLLPLNPTESGSAHSPYHSPSAFAGNPLLISPRVLAEQGLLTAAEVKPGVAFPNHQVAFGRVVRLKQRLLMRACRRYDDQGDAAALERFCRKSVWLEDFALFTVLRRHYHPRPWFQWPRALRERRPEALQTARKTFGDEIRHQKNSAISLFSTVGRPAAVLPWAADPPDRRHAHLRAAQQCRRVDPSPVLQTHPRREGRRRFRGCRRTTSATPGSYGGIRSTTGRRCRRPTTAGGPSACATT